MATNTVPFISDDPAKLVHCHIAQMATPAQDLNKKVPKVISDIIMKLISKNPDERYQSTRGLRYDLEKCLRSIKNNSIEYFEIATHDISNILHLPSLLYGRDKEVSLLKEAFQNCSRGDSKLFLYQDRRV